MKNEEKYKCWGDIKKLNIKEGDLLVVRVSQLNPNIDKFSVRLREMLDNKDLKNVSVILIGNDIDIEVLDKKEMLKLGWLKKEDIGLLISGEDKDE